MKKSTNTIAAYLRVSTQCQNEDSQRREITRWLERHDIDSANVVWFVDKATGDNLDRTEFKRLQKAIFKGEVKTVVCWKLDRLSRSLKDGINTLCEWCERGIRMVSVTQELDLSGTVGKLIASVLFAVAEMEQQTRRERQAVGIAAARAKGKRWGGSKPGERKKVTDTQKKMIVAMKEQKEPIAAIARAVRLSRPTVYAVLSEV